MASNRGFGIEVEKRYGSKNSSGSDIATSSFSPDWWNHAESVNFKLNDSPVTRSGSSRMNKRARAGIMKPTGSTTADADLQQLAWYFYGCLDNYVFTSGGSGATEHTHEFYGGEGKELPSFRGIAMFDMLKKFLRGMVIDELKLDVSNEGMSVGAEWIYKTESAAIDAAFSEPADLTNEQIFIMFYDVSLYLGTETVSNEVVPKALDGISTAFSLSCKNNHNVDKAIGLGSRAPQKRPQAGKRETNCTITTTLTSDTARSILDAEYGEVSATSPSTCKLLQLPLEVHIAHCEDADIGCTIIFPKCNVRVEYSMSGVDTVEATLSLDTLGTGTVKLADNTTTVSTDMYVKLVNNQTKVQTSDS